MEDINEEDEVEVTVKKGLDKRFMRFDAKQLRLYIDTGKMQEKDAEIVH